MLHLLLKENGRVPIRNITNYVPSITFNPNNFPDGEYSLQDTHGFAMDVTIKNGVLSCYLGICHTIAVDEFGIELRFPLDIVTMGHEEGIIIVCGY